MQISHVNRIKEAVIAEMQAIARDYAIIMAAGDVRVDIQNEGSPLAMTIDLTQFPITDDAMKRDLYIGLDQFAQTCGRLSPGTKFRVMQSECDGVARFEAASETSLIRALNKILDSDNQIRKRSDTTPERYHA